MKEKCPKCKKPLIYYDESLVCNKCGYFMNQSGEGFWDGYINVKKEPKDHITEDNKTFILVNTFKYKKDILEEKEKYKKRGYYVRIKKQKSPYLYLLYISKERTYDHLLK